MPSDSIYKKKRQVHVVTAVNNNWITRFSKLPKLLRVTAYCKRFITNCRLPHKQRSLLHLSAKEIQDALLIFVKCVQGDIYCKEIKSLQEKHEISNKSNIKSLTPFLDKDGLLRVGGRLQHSKLCYDNIHQLILPQSHHFTKLVVEAQHVKLLHAGPQLLISSIREQFWIPNIKKLIRAVLHRCLKCYRLKAKVSQQLMGQLPSSRCQPSHPFQVTGVDYAGPLSIRLGAPRSKTTCKAYIAVFVCFSTKAVHLEVVTSLTTEAFLAALRRFISRRGMPSEIQSDHGTNFQGAAHQLHKLYELLQSKEHNHKVQAFLADNCCSWKFIPPHAPHFGGIWEAAVKSMKFHLKRVIGDQVYTYEEISTFLTQVEACMNSRPLYQLPEDPHGPTVLTPGHFLIGRALTQLPAPVFDNISAISRWQQQQQRVQQFWTRWSKDYLQELQQRRRWKETFENIKPGQLVLLKEDNVLPLNWPIGIVEQIYHGYDNHVRVISVRTSKGVFKRPISKVVLLPKSD